MNIWLEYLLSGGRQVEWAYIIKTSDICLSGKKRNAFNWASISVNILWYAVRNKFYSKIVMHIGLNENHCS